MCKIIFENDNMMTVSIKEWKVLQKWQEVDGVTRTKHGFMHFIIPPGAVMKILRKAA